MTEGQVCSWVQARNAKENDIADVVGLLVFDKRLVVLLLAMMAMMAVMEQ